MQHDCPRCGGPEMFWRSASMELHLGEKSKWRCSECDYGLILIDDGADIDSSRADA